MPHEFDWRALEAKVRLSGSESLWCVQCGRTVRVMTLPGDRLLAKPKCKESCWLNAGKDPIGKRMQVFSFVMEGHSWLVPDEWIPERLQKHRDQLLVVHTKKIRGEW